MNLFAGRGGTRLSLLTFAVLLLAAFLLLHGSYLLSALVLAGIYTIVVIGMILLTGLSGQYSIGHAAFFGIGAYAAAILGRHGVPPLAGAVAAVAITTFVAVAIGVPLLRLKGNYLAVATLAFGLIVTSVLNGWQALTLGPSGITDIPPFSIGPLIIKGEAANYWFAWGLAFFGVWGGTNLWRSRVGQAVLAIKHDEAGAAALGIDVARAKVQIFALSAAFAGLGGVVYAHYFSFIAPERFGMLASFELLLAALLGGVGTPFGAVLGALLLIALPEVVAPLRDFKVIVYGVIFILLALYFPQGIAGIAKNVAASFRPLGRRLAATPRP